MARRREARDAIAAALGVSRGTLEKHCMAELKAKPDPGATPVSTKPAPAWTPSQEQRDRVAILAGSRFPTAGIALDLGVTVDQLKAACSAELTEGAARKRADVIVAMFKSAAAGNVSAAKAYALLEAVASAPAPAPASRKGQPRRDEAPAPRPIALGKKAARQVAAVDAEAGTAWANVLPQPGPLQ